MSKRDKIFSFVGFHNDLQKFTFFSDKNFQNIKRPQNTLKIPPFSNVVKNNFNSIPLFFSQVANSYSPSSFLFVCKKYHLSLILK